MVELSTKREDVGPLDMLTSCASCPGGVTVFECNFFIWPDLLDTTFNQASQQLLETPYSLYNSRRYRFPVVWNHHGLSTIFSFNRLTQFCLLHEIRDVFLTMHFSSLKKLLWQLAATNLINCCEHTVWETLCKFTITVNGSCTNQNSHLRPKHIV